jgi:hypothetical protein
MSKYKGIDSREIKCCDPSDSHHEAGISFDVNEGQNILNFHYLYVINRAINDNYDQMLTLQATKSMWLNKENTDQLIKALQDLKFD